MGRMENKVAVITGAGGGLCEGIARSFAREGAKVVLVDKKPVVLEKAKEICEDGGEALGLNLDIYMIRYMAPVRFAGLSSKR